MTTLPDYFLIGDDGSLYDTRKSYKTAIRESYRYAFRDIRTTRQLLATLRHGKYAWPGGYPLYFITSDGGALSFETVRSELRNIVDSIRSESKDGWRVVACDINYEDANLLDDHTGEPIESAYGE